MREKLRMRIGTSVLGLVVLFCALSASAQERRTEEPPATVAPGTLGGAPAGPSEAPKPTEKPIRIPLTEVIGTGPAALEHIPGSGRVVTRESLEKNRRFTINEALREVPGVNVRDEEGFGLRPNIGIRGLNPTRSTKIHIMEDGVPIMLMPYGDASTYFFPPLFRFDRIEILKGSGQLLFGPQNIGGVMNMITRMPSPTPQGNLQVMGGNLSYLNTHLDYGGMWGRSGYLLDATHYQGTSPRFFQNRAKVDDMTFKTVQEISDRTAILAKFNYYREDSTIGYQGITEKQWGQDPHHSPFNNDRMDFRRIGFHVAVNNMWTANLTSTTNFFGHYISRDWGRQMQDADGDPSTGDCTVNGTGGVGGGCVTGNNINATAPDALPANGRFINARKYWVYGVEPRFHAEHRLFGIASQADFGVRYMYEESERKQFLNASSGIGVSCPGFSADQASCLGEDTHRTTNAYALFFQNRFLLTDQITITPGFRVEHVNYDQVDKRAPAVGGINQGTGVFTKTSITEVLPGLGMTYSPVKNYTLFAGVHRGFAPPQISDAIQSNVVVDLDAELSWNYEVGLRSTPVHWLGYELTFFRMDFQNQIISQSVAGGAGATNTNAGRTAHSGIEFAFKADMLDMITGLNRDHDITVDFNYTWLGQAEFRGTRNSNIGGTALLPGESATFNTNNQRLPYAPKNMLTAGLGYANRLIGFDGRAEVQCISDMFGDDRNTHNPTPNGQRGIIRGWCVLNAAANQYVKLIKTTFFITGKNLLDQLFMVDRTRGIYPGLPLLVQAGAKWSF
jgi:Fe(3+) dicitrate transport protein